jgi:hypothetical protein
VRRGKRNWMVGRKGPLITNTCIGLTHQMTLLHRAVGMAYASGLQYDWNEVATAETRKQTSLFCHIEVIDGGLADADADATNPFLVQGGKGSLKVVPKKYGERDSSHQNEVC